MADDPGCPWNVETLKQYVDVRLEAMQEAVNKSDAAYEKRMDNVNEFRATLSDQQSTFITKEQVRWTFMALIGGIAVATAIFAAINGVTP